MKSTLSIAEGSSVNASVCVTPPSGHTEVLIGEAAIDLTSDSEDSHEKSRRKVGSGIGSATNSSGSGSGSEGARVKSASLRGEVIIEDRSLKDASGSGTSLKRKREDDRQKQVSEVLTASIIYKEGKQ
jgi:hypothetical protein